MLYDEVTMSQRRKNSTVAFTEAICNNYNKQFESNSKASSGFNVFEEMGKNNASYSASMYAGKTLNAERYSSFTESLGNVLTIEALYKMYSECVHPKIAAKARNKNIMRAIVSEYVNDVGHRTILAKMKKASTPMCEMYYAIKEAEEEIKSEVDPTDPTTFTITPEMKDDFFAALDYSDTEAINDAIKERVTNAMEDFVNDNLKDHDDIKDALEDAKEKIEAEHPVDNTPSGEDTEEDSEDGEEDSTDAVAEYYQYKAKRFINEARMRDKSIFHAMVSAVCESTMKHQDTHHELMKEGHLNMDKIILRTNLMYTFLEMLNTTRLENVDATYLNETIQSLRA